MPAVFIVSCPAGNRSEKIKYITTDEQGMGTIGATRTQMMGDDFFGVRVEVPYNIITNVHMDLIPAGTATVLTILPSFISRTPYFALRIAFSQNIGESGKEHPETTETYARIIAELEKLFGEVKVKSEKTHGAMRGITRYVTIPGSQVPLDKLQKARENHEKVVQILAKY